MKKYVRIIGFGILITTSIISCKKQEENKVLPDPSKNPFREQVQMQEDLVKEAKTHALTTLALSEPSYDFGKIKKGVAVEHVFEVTNTGKNPLILSSVRPTCGCTVSDYTKEPILSGQKGKINLKFNSANFEGMVHKTAEIYANVEQVPIEIRFTAEIEK